MILGGQKYNHPDNLYADSCTDLRGSNRFDIEKTSKYLIENQSIRYNFYNSILPFGTEMVYYLNSFTNNN